jgi:hypothetical protein
VSLYLTPKRLVNDSFRPVASLLQHPTHRGHHRLVDCCINPSSRSYQRPVLRPSLNSLMGSIWASQTRESAAVHTNPVAGRLL